MPQLQQTDAQEKQVLGEGPQYAFRRIGLLIY